MNRTGAYRLFLTDKISFEKEFYHGIEHGETGNDFPVDYIGSIFYAAQPLWEEWNLLLSYAKYFSLQPMSIFQLMQVTPERGIGVILDRGLMLTAYGRGSARIAIGCS